MSSADSEKSPYNQALTERREHLLERLRHQGDLMQKYLAVVNGGGLIATFALFGIFVQRGIAPGYLMSPGLLFASGLGAAGWAHMRALKQQRLGLEKIDELSLKLEDKEITDEIAEKAWVVHSAEAKNRAIFSQRIQTAGIFVFFCGILLGLLILGNMSLPIQHDCAGLI